jgi:hypothetical protein
MKRLGEILLERSFIDVAELHTGLEACHHRGGRLGTHLLNFGFVDEHSLLKALSEQLDVPFVSAEVLRRAPGSLRRMVPPHVARRLQVVVFDRNGENLSVAMTTPRDPAILGEVVSHVNMVIKPHVATEVAILDTLSEVREETATPLPDETKDGPGVVHAGESAPATNADLEEWQSLWSPPTLQSRDLLRPRRDRSPKYMPLAATFPGLAPVPVNGAMPADDLDNEIFSAMLRDARHRDEVGELLLRRASAVVERCYLLAVHADQMVGWLAHGSGVVLDDVQSLVVSTDEASILSKLKGPRVFYGRIEPGPVNDELLRAFGEPAPGEIAVIPVTVKNRVVAYLFGDVPGSTISKLGQEQLLEAAQKAGVAFEILIMKKKFFG